MEKNLNPNYRKENRKQSSRSAALRYAGMGMQLMVMLALAVWAGMYLDKKLAWSFPLFVVSFPLVAICFFLYKLIKELGKPPKP